MYSKQSISPNEYEKTKQIEEYLIRMQGNDKTALASLYETLKTSVYSFALSIVKNKDDAEDILHETFIKIYQSADTYIAKGKPVAWILTITKNLSLMKLRSSKKTTEISDEMYDKLAVNENISKEDKLVLKATLEILLDEERQIITLYAISGLKHREIALLLNMPLATVLSKYHRALKKMKKYLLGEV